YVSRHYFDQDRGLEMLKAISAFTLESSITASYIVLASCYCLLRYCENITGSSFAPGSMRITVVTGQSSRMTIDRATAVDLE
ncbi:unnamed protein product, partial [Chrysoparadoxa australica]